MRRAVSIAVRTLVGICAATALAAGGSARAMADQTPIPVQSAAASPYGHVPVPGNRVSFDGTSFSRSNSDR